MVGVRIKRSDSWLDPECSGLLGWKLGKRLWARVAGSKGVFITLTYRRDGYSDALDLYRRQAERQDVALFMRRLARRLGSSLRGRWICKLEFQRGGWVHWHIILLGVERIEHQLLTETWGLGHVWIKKLTKKRVFYTCKYVCKGGDHNLPPWVYGERPRSVKVVRASPGFWGEGRKAAKSEPGPGSYVNGYVPIGVKLGRKGVVINHAAGRFSRLCDPGEFMWRLRRVAPCTGSSNGWLWFPVGVELINAVYAACVLASTGAAPSAGAQPNATPPPGGLHLRGTGNPDADRRAVYPAWYEEQLYTEAMEAWTPSDAA